MNWLPHFALPNRHSRETGSTGTTGRGRLFVYLAVTVIALLLSYQLVLNRESLSSVSRWAVGKGLAPAVNHDESDPETGATQVQQLESPPPRKKELVLAAMSYSNMSWVQENVPQWYTNIYRADVPPGKADLTVPVNKGNEAMVFLTFVYLSLLWSDYRGLTSSSVILSIATRVFPTSWSSCMEVGISGITIIHYMVCILQDTVPLTTFILPPDLISRKSHNSISNCFQTLSSPSTTSNSTTSAKQATSTSAAPGWSAAPSNSNQPATCASDPKTTATRRLSSFPTASWSSSPTRKCPKSWARRVAANSRCRERKSVSGGLSIISGRGGF